MEVLIFREHFEFIDSPFTGVWRRRVNVALGFRRGADIAFDGDVFANSLTLYLRIIPYCSCNIHRSLRSLQIRVETSAQNIYTRLQLMRKIREIMVP